MAEVYRAVLRGAGGFEKVVALKRILPYFGGDEDFITLFRDEARIASTLTHANIAQVFDFGEVDGSLYMTMELVEGADLTTLGDRLRKEGQPMPLATAAFIVAEAARGLAYAHDKRGSDGQPLGIVHRDVSPHNILVSYEGEVKVTDFGIAKATGKVHKTATGVVMGKLRYMSPEQVAGEALDPRSDLFSLGVVLYELLTGGPIFPGDQSLRLAELIHTATIPPPSTQNPAVPRQLDDIVMKALEKSREKRYARGGELARDLTVYVNQSAPGFTREDLGALIQRVAPPKAPPPVTPGVPATAVEKKTPPQPGALDKTEATGGPPLVTIPPVAEAAPSPPAAPPLAASAAAEDDEELKTPGPSAFWDAMGTVERSPSVNARAAAAAVPPKRRRLSTELLVGLILLAVIAASGIGILVRFGLTKSDRKKLAAGGVPDATSVIVPVLAADAGPPPDTAFTLVPTAAEDERRRLDAVVTGHDVSRRGAPSADYHVFLTALDSIVATQLLDDDGTADESTTLPPSVASAVATQRLEPAVDAVAAYFRATGDLPPNVKAALRSYLGRAQQSVVAYPTLHGPRRLPPYSAAALAVWLGDQKSRRLVELAYANDTLRRWCEPPAPPKRHFAPVLCERAALSAELRKVTPHDRTAQMLDRWSEAIPVGQAVTVSEGATAAVRHVGYRSGDRPDTYELVVELATEGAPTGTPRVEAMTAEGRPEAAAPQHLDDVMSADGTEKSGARLTFQVSRRMFAPVLVWGIEALQLPPPPWNGPE